MRLILHVPAHLLDDAWEILRVEVDRYAEYNKVGWGWGHGAGDRRFFVRRLKDGLSITHVPRA